MLFLGLVLCYAADYPGCKYTTVAVLDYENNRWRNYRDEQSSIFDTFVINDDGSLTAVFEGILDEYPDLLSVHAEKIEEEVTNVELPPLTA